MTLTDVVAPGAVTDNSLERIFITLECPCNYNSYRPGKDLAAPQTSSAGISQYGGNA